MSASFFGSLVSLLSGDSALVFLRLKPRTDTPLIEKGDITTQSHMRLLTVSGYVLGAIMCCCLGSIILQGHSQHWLAVLLMAALPLAACHGAMRSRTPRIFEQKLDLLFLGLDQAGKTTLARALSDGSAISTELPVAHAATLVPTTVQFEVKLSATREMKIRGYDVGHWGQQREIGWVLRHTTPRVIDAAIFLIDASDHSRFTEAATMLQNVVETIGGHLEEMQPYHRACVAVVANRGDVPGAASRHELQEVFAVDKIQEVAIENVLLSEVFMLGPDRIEIQGVMQWLSESCSFR